MRSRTKVESVSDVIGESFKEIKIKTTEVTERVRDLLKSFHVLTNINQILNFKYI